MCSARVSTIRSKAFTKAGEPRPLAVVRTGASHPNQRNGWHPVAIEKMGAWYLLMLLSYVLVSIVHKPEAAPVEVAPSVSRKPILAAD